MKATERTVTEFTYRLLRKMSGKYGGDMTLNELRVMNRVYKCYFIPSIHYCGIGGMSRALDIPRSTVSRACRNLLDKGWLREVQHDDQRRRCFKIGTKAEARLSSDWAECIGWLEEFS